MKSLVLVLAIIAVSCSVISLPTEPETPESQAVDFITGFLEGLNEKGDVNKLLECVKDIDIIIDNVIEGLELILTKKADKIIVGVTKIIGAIRDLLNKISPCSKGFDQILKLIEAFKHIDILDIALRFLENPEPYVTDVVRAVEAFKNKNFREGGKRVGSFLFKLFLAKEIEESPEDNVVDIIFKSIEGFFAGLNSGEDINEILECIRRFPVIVFSVKEAIAKIQSIDIKNKDSIFAAITAVVESLRSVVNTIIPCYESKNNMEHLWEKIKNIDFEKRMQKLMGEIFNIIHYITKAGQDFKEKQYYEFGTDVGKVLFIILFKP
jgi:hypothetical protein